METKIEEIIFTARDVFLWYYIFGEDNDAAKERLARLGNALKIAGFLEPIKKA